MLVAPIAHVEAIDRGVLNDCLVRWGHRMGPWDRPSYREWAHALFRHGEPVAVAVAVAAQLIKEPVAGLMRAEAFELGRLCASGPHLNRVMLRLWRDFVGSEIAARHGYEWVVSYQDLAMHNGNTYRFDGWTRLGRSRSGTDKRSGKVGRDKTIWGWRYG